ncbi:MAG: helix-turn-helix domain-containing protein [Actinomycetales bacterium]|jgi:excisionase family DNA binding protein|nr:helix-turn-helix domain-containing protein [Candidatus Phosphoribacter baldrii]
MTGLSVDDVRGRATLSIPEAARLMSVGRNQMYAAAAAGTIPTLRIGKRLLVPTAPLLAMLGHSVPAA